nr:hypothetical protein [Tanacetum cinerariifolium]
MDSQSTPVVSAPKLPILNLNEFDLWKMRIEQYFLMIDYSLWEVIISGDSPVPTVVVKGAVQPTAILTAEQKLARRNELKARGTLLMALPDKHKLKFNSHKDAKTLMEAIEKRFERNTETKKKLVSKLEIHGVSLSQEDVNLKFLRSLPSEWKTHTLIWRNKANLEEHSLNDLFNSLRIYKSEVKHSFLPSNPIQNIAFVSSSNTDSTTDSVSAATSVSTVCAQLPVSSHLNIDSLSNAVIFSFFASQSTSPQLDNEDLKQIDVDDLEEMDLRWQMAMLTMRAKRSHKYNRRTVAVDPQRRHVPVETSTSNALVSQCDGIGSYDWSYQAKEEPANFAFMAIPSSSSASDNKVKSCTKACSKSYDKLHFQYDKLTIDFCKSQFDVFFYQAALESVKARLVLYKQNESILQENINMLKNEVQARDNVLVTLKQKLNQAEKERDDLKLKFDKFQSSSKSLTELLASQTNSKHGLGYYSKSDCETLSLSSLSDRSQPSGDYHAVPPPITGNFMPPKPDLVFHTAPIAVETTHSAFTVSDSEDESDPNDPQSALSFVQSFEHAKLSRHSVLPVEASILETKPNSTSSKTNDSRRKNRKTFFVCRGVDHLIKDCNFHSKPKTQPTTRNFVHRSYDKQYASSTKKYSQKHIVPAVVLTKSKPVSVTAARPVIAAVPKIMKSRPRHAYLLNKKSNPSIRRYRSHNQFSKTNNSYSKVTAAKVSVVSAVKGKKGKWVWRPKCPILDHDSRTSGNISYLSDFQELNGGYVAFGGNSKGGKITGILLHKNHDSRVTKFLNEVNSRAKVPSNKTTNRNKPVEQISVAKKPERQILKGHRFLIKKTSVVHEKTITLRTCLKWKPMGKTFKIVGLRWVPTGNKFTSSTTKVDSKPTNGSNDDITNQYECKQTLDVSAGTLNLSAGTSFNPKKEELRVCLELEIYDHSNEPCSSKLVSKVVPLAVTTAPSKQELDLLFSPLYDEFSMQTDELYMFLDGTFKLVRDELHHKILNFCLGYSKEMPRRNWNLERFVGARELEMDYKLM